MWAGLFSKDNLKGRVSHLRGERIHLEEGQDLEIKRMRWAALGKKNSRLGTNTMYQGK